MPLKPYEQFLAEPLAFPIGGKTYTPPPIGARTGIALIRALAGEGDMLTAEPRSLWQMVLGPVYDDMIEDDVPLDALARAGFAVLVDWQNDRSAAERVWESGIDPEARAALAAALRVNSTTSPNTGGVASSTKPPANTSGTTSPSRKPRRVSSGKTSSARGT